MAEVPIKYCGGEEPHESHDWGSDQDYICPGLAE